MDAQTFLNNFGAIANAPGGIDMLRDLVVSLAVRGRLVPQSMNDVSATALLQDIAAEQQTRKGNRRTAGHLERASRPAGPRGWCRARLSEVLDLEYGKSLPTKSRDADGPIPVYGSNGVIGFHNEYLVERPCVVVGRKGSSGAVNVAEEPCWPIDTTYFVVPYAGMSIHFVALLLRSLRLDELDRATAVPGLNREEAYSLEIELPPLAEQDRIVLKVDELMQLCDDLEARQGTCHDITARTRASALDALTAARSGSDLSVAWTRIEQNWSSLIGDAEGVAAVRTATLQLAVEGRLTSARKSDGTVVELLDQIQPGLVSSDPVDPSRIPYELPSTWSWVHLENVCTHIVDCLHKTPHYVEHGYPAIRTSDVEPGRILLDRAKRVDEATFTERTSRLPVIEGDVVYSREGGRFGIAATVPPGVELCLGQRMMQFRCCPGVNPEYFSLFLNSPLGFGQASADVGGSASPHVNIKAIRRFVLPLPPPAEQQRIVERVHELEGACRQLRTALIRLHGVGDALARSLTASVI